MTMISGSDPGEKKIDNQAPVAGKPIKISLD